MLSPKKRNNTSTPDNVIDRKRQALLMAKGPFVRLVQQGVSPEVLEKFMYRLLFCAEIKLPKDLNKPKSMASYTLKRFPNKIDELAMTIQKLNDEPLLDLKRLRDHLLPQSSHGSRDLVKTMKSIREHKVLYHAVTDFHRLPTILHEYAEYLRLIVKQLGRAHRHPYNPFHHYLVALAQHVRDVTHKHFLKDIADFATALLWTAGGHGTIEPDTIRKLYKNHPEFRPISWALSKR